MKFNTIRFKIRILYTTILGIIIFVYASILYASLSYSLYKDFDKRLVERATDIKNTINSYLDILGFNQKSFVFSLKRALNIKIEVPEEYKVEKFKSFWSENYRNLPFAQGYVNFLDAEGNPIVRSPNLDSSLLPFFLEDVNDVLIGKTIIKNIREKERRLRVVSIPVSFKGERQYAIQVAESLAPLNTFMKTRLYYSLFPVPIILLLGYFIGHIFAGRILKPVAEITAIAERISHEGLYKRVEAKDIDKEMRSLVDAFNNMISRLDKSFNHIAEFSSHVSHELKTPLAIIRGEIELALRKEQTSAGYKRALKVSLEELERMHKIIEDLLLSARIDYQPDFFIFKNFDLSEFLEEICEQTKLLASEKNIIVKNNIFKNSMVICADKVHLRRLFFNLITNSIKFTSSGGKIDIMIKCKGKEVLTFISDTGIGIKKDDLPKIFDKFFCGDLKGKSLVYSCGLGLNIAQSIAKIHNGRIEAESEEGKGTSFTVILPLV